MENIKQPGGQEAMSIPEYEQGIGQKRPELQEVPFEKNRNSTDREEGVRIEKIENMDSFLDEQEKKDEKRDGNN